MNKYIVLNDNVILRVYESESIKSVEKALANSNIHNYTAIERIEPDAVYPILDYEDCFSVVQKPKNGMKIADSIPEQREGFIPRWDNKNKQWEYVENTKGLWYHKETKELRIISNINNTDSLSQYTKLTPKEEPSKWENDQWVLDIDRYRETAKYSLRKKCRNEREKYFPDDVKDNLLVGIEYENKKLTINNYKKLADYYRSIVHTNELLLDNTITKEDVDNIINSIKFPIESEILSMVE